MFARLAPQELTIVSRAVDFILLLLSPLALLAALSRFHLIIGTKGLIDVFETFVSFEKGLTTM